MNRIESILMIVLMADALCSYAQKTPEILYSSDDDGRVYTSLEEALLNPQKVYRLKLTKLPAPDSLPPELFQLTELRELTVKGCRLCILNRQISELSHLVYLNLDRNKLLRLPSAIGELHHLQTLVISRNILETLPDSIAKLTNLVTIDAWDNPLYVLPESISALSNTLKILDLRQIPLSRKEYDAMELLLPNTDIMFTDICECENRRDHD